MTKDLREVIEKLAALENERKVCVCVCGGGGGGVVVDDFTVGGWHNSCAHEPGECACGMLHSWGMA